MLVTNPAMRYGRAHVDSRRGFRRRPDTGGGRRWHLVALADSVGAPRDRRSLYERERARAEAAEARCEELRRAEVASRSRAGSLKSQFDACRNKLRAAEEETKEVRRTAKRQEGRIKFL